MAQSATVMTFASPDNTARLQRLQRLRVFAALEGVKKQIDQGIRTTRQNNVFMIDFSSALEIEGCAESDVERLVRNWVYEQYENDLELERYESAPRSRCWSLHFLVK